MNETNGYVLLDLRDIQTRITNLESIVGALIKRIDNDKFYANADTSALRQTDGTQAGDIDRNSADIDYLAMMTEIDIPTEE